MIAKGEAVDAKAAAETARDVAQNYAAGWPAPRSRTWPSAYWRGGVRHAGGQGLDARSARCAQPPMTA
ncbi:hypothetical protein ACU4GD_28220 [Cupriavidus basilensis]